MSSITGLTCVSLGFLFFLVLYWSTEKGVFRTKPKAERYAFWGRIGYGMFFVITSMLGEVIASSIKEREYAILVDFLAIAFGVVIVGTCIDFILRQTTWHPLLRFSLSLLLIPSAFALVVFATAAWQSSPTYWFLTN